MVTYQRKTEFLDDYSPTIQEVEKSNIESKHGTIVTIKNLDTPIKNNGWNLLGVKKELQDFFGYLVRSGKKNLTLF